MMINKSILKKVGGYDYPVFFTYDAGKEIAVVFPDLDVVTSGINEDDALLSTRKLLECVLHELAEDGETFPDP